jgi:hypothetical protein
MKTITKILIAVIYFTSCSPALTVQPKTNGSAAVSMDVGYAAYLISRHKQWSNSAIPADDYFSKGYAKMNSKDTNELKLARQYLKASLVYDGAYPETWMLLGEISVKESELTKDTLRVIKLIEAIYYYNKAIATDSTNNVFYYRRGLCSYNLGDTTYLSDYRKSCGLGNADACAAIKSTK